jgi:hypothetical protein
MTARQPTPSEAAMALTMRDRTCVIVETRRRSATAGHGPHDSAGHALVADTDLRQLEGRQVSLAPADGSRLDAVTLVSAGRERPPTLWLCSAGSDLSFVTGDAVLGAWEPGPSPRRNHV